MDFRKQLPLNFHCPHARSWNFLFFFFSVTVRKTNGSSYLQFAPQVEEVGGRPGARRISGGVAILPKGVVQSFRHEAFGEPGRANSASMMEGSGAGIGRLDCYEDMFKEITRKLYGDDPDHRSKNPIFPGQINPLNSKKKKYIIGQKKRMVLTISDLPKSDSLECAKRVRDVGDVQDGRGHR